MTWQRPRVPRGPLNLARLSPVGGCRVDPPDCQLNSWTRVRPPLQGDPPTRPPVALPETRYIDPWYTRMYASRKVVPHVTMLYAASTGDFDVRLAQATHFLCATLDHHRKPLRVRPACFPAHAARCATLVDPSLCFRVLSRSIYVLETGQGACAGSIPTSRACPASTILANLFCARARMLVLALLDHVPYPLATS